MYVAIHLHTYAYRYTHTQSLLDMSLYSTAIRVKARLQHVIIGACGSAMPGLCVSMASGVVLIVGCNHDHGSRPSRELK